MRFVASIGYAELLMTRHAATSSDQEVRILAGSNQRLRRLLGQLGQLPIDDSADDTPPARTAACRSLPAPLPEEPPDEADRLGA